MGVSYAANWIGFIWIESDDLRSGDSLSTGTHEQSLHLPCSSLCKLFGKLLWIGGGIECQKDGSSRGLVMSVALSLRGFSDRLLRGHDFTYGLYLLHPVVFLLMARAGLGNGMANAAFALLISCGFAAASWFLIERPFMRGKRHSSHPIPKMAKIGTSAIS